TAVATDRPSAVDPSVHRFVRGVWCDRRGGYLRADGSPRGGSGGGRDTALVGRFDPGMRVAKPRRSHRQATLLTSCGRRSRSCARRSTSSWRSLKRRLKTFGAWLSTSEPLSSTPSISLGRC